MSPRMHVGVTVAVGVAVGVTVGVTVAVGVMVAVGVGVFVGRGPTRVVTVARLFVSAVSVVLLANWARFGIKVPFGTPAAICTVIVKVADVLTARLAMPQWTGPTPARPGVTQVKAGPVFCTIETNVVSGGVVSVRATFEASAGRLLVTVSV